ncbi:MAG: threonine synthase [Actinomycetota bacterium]|nr:threonine synthase [Actinomycetota bacterium]
MLRALRCTGCGALHPTSARYKCPACGTVLDAEYDADPAAVRALIERAAHAGSRSLWAFGPLLPVAPEVPPVSLGEGWTPLLPAERSEGWAGLTDLWLKIEAANPTGSFKDRPVSVALSKAREFGVEGVVTASSGNAGASVAAYAARAGLPAVVLVPDGLPSSKLAQIASYGPQLLAVRGHFSRAYDLALAWAESSGWYDVTTTLLSAFPTEGNKAVAYELWLQLRRVPDWILIPVSAGPLLVGIWKGYLELKAAGLVDRLPRMVAVQAAGCAPIAKAFARGDTTVEAWGDPITVASGIRDPLQGYADDGTLTLRRVRESGGAAIAVTDLEILNAAEAIARHEGQAAEPTGAVAVAGAIAMARDGRLAPDHSVVCLVTGHGLKDPQAYAEHTAPPVTIEPNLDSVSRALDVFPHSGGSKEA